MHHQPTALLGWELGGGLGHARRLLRLADALAIRGVRPVLAGDVRSLADSSHLVLPAPWLPPKPRPVAFRALSFADVLAVRGFGSVADLRALIRGWDGLLTLVKPDIVVAESAPVLTLAAGSLSLVQLGTGFTLPPYELPAYPALRDDAAAEAPESTLLAHASTVLAERNRPTPPTLPALFAGRRWLAVVPELDPYRHFRTEPHAGPLEPLPLPTPPGTGAFAYLNADVASSGPVLELLTRAGLLAGAYLRGATAEQRAALRTVGVPLHDTPPPLIDALATCAAVIHHGGLGVAQAALAAGRTQLIFPEHLEHTLTADALRGLGVAQVLDGTFTADAVIAAAHALASPDSVSQATTAASAVAARGPLPGVAALADAVAAGASSGAVPLPQSRPGV